MEKLSTIQQKALGASHPFKRGLKSLISLWLRNHRTRKALNGMEQHRLHDIGIDPAQASAESHKPFWR